MQVKCANEDDKGFVLISDYKEILAVLSQL